MRRPTSRELIWFWATTRRARRPRGTAAQLEAMFATHGNFLRVLQGRPPAPPPPDPDRCPSCRHSIGRAHTDTPKGYGCCECLCLMTPGRHRAQQARRG